MSGRRFAAAVIAVVGVLIIIAGVLYLTQPAHALPSFLPGHAARALGKHTKRGIAALVVGVVLFLVGGALAMTRRTTTTFARRRRV